MLVHKFRVKNYKAIVDSGDCYLSDGITILAGKNEAGKSSLLEALEDFNQGRPIREAAIPIDDDTLVPEIIVWLDLSTIEQAALLRQANRPERDSDSDIRVRITKIYPQSYSVDTTEWQGVGMRNDLFESIVNEAFRSLMLPYDHTRVAAESGHPLPKGSSDDYPLLLRMMQEWQSRMPEFIGHWPETLHDELRSKVQAVVAALQRLIAGHDPSSNISALLIDKLPNFVLFSSFEDVVPNQVPLGELESNGWIKDLQAISNLDIAKIRGSNERTKVTHKTQLNVRLNDDFQRYWSQDDSKLFVDYDNQKLSFWFQENGKFYEPAIRSQGRRWHLAFYIRVSARASEDVRNVILIDEPGLYLHANAQRDILLNLEQASVKAQIVFTTHSPYLIEHDKLDRIRLVRKLSDSGTVVENKVHAVADKETLTPILTAIGLELNRGIVAAERRNNVVVEGPSDYYYLHALKVVLGKSDINFVHGGGAGNMPKIGTILQGWGCQVMYLYDNDAAFKEAKKNVARQWVTINKDLLAKLLVDGSIEDVFTKDDFAVHVLGVDSATVEGKNSVHMKTRDKVLPAKKFLEKCRSASAPTLSAETLAISNKLFKLIEDTLRATAEHY